MRVSGAQGMMNDLDETYQKYVELYQDNKIDADGIAKDVANGRTDPEVFSWEFAEILLSLEVPVAQYRSDITEVLQAIVAKNRLIGYCQGMNYIVAWLLIFLSKREAFWLFTFYLEKTLVSGYYSGSSNNLNGFFIESTTIGKLLEKIIPDIAENPYKESFADLISVQPLIQLFVDCIDVESTVFIWEMLAC